MVGIHKHALGLDVVAAAAKAKDDWRRNLLREYRGLELINSQVGRRGAKFFEANVGKARPEDPMGREGSRRLVLLVQSGRITEIYFSDNHYRIGSWKRILDV